MSEYCIDCKNYEGIRITFSEKQRSEKAFKHPELNEEGFIKRIVKAVTNPHFVYEDLSDKNRYAYYIREYAINSRIIYTKVIVKKRDKICFIITAYRPDYVKERSKSRLLYGEDNE